MRTTHDFISCASFFETSPIILAHPGGILIAKQAGEFRDEHGNLKISETMLKQRIIMNRTYQVVGLVAQLQKIDSDSITG